MNANQNESRENGDLRAAIANLSQRLQVVEERLGIGSAGHPTIPIVPGLQPDSAEPAPLEVQPAGQRESLEFELGQNWFALIGIVVLAIGMAFLLSLPYPGLPAFLPSLGGYVLSGLILLVARLARRSFDAIARYLRGAGILLLFFSTLRLFYFGEAPALETGSPAGQGILLLVLTVNLVLAWRRDSPQLFVLALITGFATALAVEHTVFFLATVTGLILLAALAHLVRDWRAVSPVAFALAMVSYLVWLLGNPQLGNPVVVRSGAVWPCLVVLLWIVLVTLVLLGRVDTTREDAPVQITGLLLCGLGFGGYTIHGLLGLIDSFLVLQLVASVVFLALALVFWIREESWFSTFLYSMTGYAALSLALINGFGIPEVFVALSLQSLVVIATAIYFRSRFIIVANCLIFVGIILGYMALAKDEQGMSLGFGVVALVSARVLNWQKDRLVLKTDLMRISYLVIAFLVFPYALYYLVPPAYVAVSWVGLALFYYGMNLVIRNRRYRWMGHMTLLLTALYVVIVGTSQLDSVYRILSFLVLGSIMLVVSLAFTMARARRNREDDK